MPQAGGGGVALCRRSPGARYDRPVSRRCGRVRAGREHRCAGDPASREHRRHALLHLRVAEVRLLAAQQFEGDLELRGRVELGLVVGEEFIEQLAGDTGTPELKADPPRPPALQPALVFGEDPRVPPVVLEATALQLGQRSLDLLRLAPAPRELLAQLLGGVFALTDELQCELERPCVWLRLAERELGLLRLAATSA